MLLKELSIQRTIVCQLTETINQIVERSGTTYSPLAERHQEMTSTFIEVEAIARDRRDELLDRLKEVFILVFCTVASSSAWEINRMTVC